MKILEVQNNIELQNAKKHLVYSTEGMLLCIIFSTFTMFEVFFSALLIIVFLYSLCAVYNFSKLAKSPLFRYYIIMPLAGLLAQLLNYISPSISYMFVSFILTIGLNLYFTYKMSHEMNAITDLPYFITAFKLYALSSCGIVAVILFVWFGLDLNNLLSSASEYSINDLADSNLYSLIALLCLLFIFCVTYCIGIGFVLRGLMRITYIKVPSESFENKIN